MRWFILIPLLLLTVLACDDEEDFDKLRNDIGDEAIRGRLFALREDGRIVAVPGEVVTLDYPPDSSATDRPDSNFVFAQPTDAEGYFTFPFLRDSTIDYRVSFFDYLFDDVLYRADSLVQSGNDSLALLATVALNGQTGLQLSTVDSATREVLPKVTACFYTSRAAFTAAADTSCAGAAFTLTTNERGYESTYGLAADTYYVRSRYRVNDSLWQSEDTLAVLPDSVIHSTIDLAVRRDTMPMATDTTVSGITFLTLDANGDVVPQATVCLFTSRFLFERDSSCTGANYRYVTNALGRRMVTAIPNGRYFVRGRFEIDSTLILVGGDTTITPRPANTIDTLRLR